MINIKKIVIATNSEHKLKEFKELLKDYEILTLKDIGFLSDIEETGTTFLENALIKSRTIHNYLNSIGLDYPVIADDSGLCCDALNGEPGLFTARYAKKHDDSQANRDKLRKKLSGKDKSAYFICTIVIYYNDDTYKEFVGKTYGLITEEEKGKKDFGYDCIFYSNDLKKNFGEATDEEKNRVSHRGRAIQQLLKELNN